MGRVIKLDGGRIPKRRQFNFLSTVTPGKEYKWELREEEPIKVIITDDMRAEAEATYKGARLNKSTVRKDGRGTIVGRLSELMVESLRPDLEYVGNKEYNFDYLSTRYKDIRRVEVKGKEQTVDMVPGIHWWGSTYAYSNKFQIPDFYVFCRVYKDKSGIFRHGWVAGTMTRLRFEKEKTFFKDGEEDPFDTRAKKFCFDGDGYHVLHGTLLNFPLLDK